MSRPKSQDTLLSAASASPRLFAKRPKPNVPTARKPKSHHPCFKITAAINHTHVILRRLLGSRGAKALQRGRYSFLSARPKPHACHVFLSFLARSFLRPVFGGGGRREHRHTCNYSKHPCASLRLAQLVRQLWSMTSSSSSSSGRPAQ